MVMTDRARRAAPRRKGLESARVLPERHAVAHRRVPPWRIASRLRGVGNAAEGRFSRLLSFLTDAAPALHCCSGSADEAPSMRNGLPPKWQRVMYHERIRQS